MSKKKKCIKLTEWEYEAVKDRLAEAKRRSGAPIGQGHYCIKDYGHYDHLDDCSIYFNIFEDLMDFVVEYNYRIGPYILPMSLINS